MNGRLAKKVSQYIRRDWRDFYEDIYKQPFKIRMKVALCILFRVKLPAEEKNDKVE